jgi:hypothetical protein
MPHDAGLLLLAPGAAPLLTGDAFPTDSYGLLWNTTALGHPSYAAGAFVVLLVAVLTHGPAAQGSVVTEGPR